MRYKVCSLSLNTSHMNTFEIFCLNSNPTDNVQGKLPLSLHGTNENTSSMLSVHKLYPHLRPLYTYDLLRAYCLDMSHTNMSEIGVTCTCTWPTLIYVHKHEPHEHVWNRCYCTWPTLIYVHKQEPHEQVWNRCYHANICKRTWATLTTCFKHAVCI